MANIPTNSRPVRTRAVAALDLPLFLSGKAGNQSRQVHAALRDAILSGRLEAGLRLPASRALAEQLGVSRNAVVSAFEALQGDGLVQARVGAGTYVAALLPACGRATRPLPAEMPQASREPFALGVPTLDRELMQRFAMALRGQAARADDASLFYGDPRGSLRLRTQIAAHLASTRGVQCNPDDIVTVPGVQQALRLCAQALLKSGHAVWVEDPGYPVARKTLVAAGMRPRPVPVDAQGIDVAAGMRRHPGAKGVYVTPSHQFPCGVTMSMGRRAALLEWARAHKAWVFEDDYDSEFRYSGPPLTALAGLDGGERVVYIGTFSKTLFPSLRLAYLALPAAAREPVVAARATFDRLSSALVEDAVATLMEDGSFSAHVRRVRKRCRVARDLIATTLDRESGSRLQIDVPTQGLHLLATLPPDLTEDAGQQIRAAANVNAVLLSETRLMRRRGEDAFVLGFAGHDLARLEEAAVRLGRATRHYGAAVR